MILHHGEEVECVEIPDTEAKVVIASLLLIGFSTIATIIFFAVVR